jgi:hypothetical protein
MKSRALVASLLFAAALPAFGAPNCGTYAVVGSQCARTVYLGWGIAGQSTQSWLNVYAPPSVSAPITFQMTALNSSLGTSYTGFFGVKSNRQSTTDVLTTAASPISFTAQPGQGTYWVISNTCFNSACTATPPAAFTGSFSTIMFSMQMQILGANATDLALVQLPLLTPKFLDSNGNVTLVEQEVAVEFPVSTAGINSLNEAGTPALRYVLSGASYVDAFLAFSVTNPSATQSLTGTLYLLDFNNNVVASSPIPSIPPLGASGYLLVGRSPGDTLGLFPYSTVLSPTGPEGVFHGTLRVNFSSPAIFLAQEFDGISMLNDIIEP